MSTPLVPCETQRRCLKWITVGSSFLIAKSSHEWHWIYYDNSYFYWLVRNNCIIIPLTLIFMHNTQLLRGNFSHKFIRCCELLFIPNQKKKQAKKSNCLIQSNPQMQKLDNWNEKLLWVENNLSMKPINYKHIKTISILFANYFLSLKHLKWNHPQVNLKPTQVYYIHKCKALW